MASLRALLDAELAASSPVSSEEEEEEEDNRTESLTGETRENVKEEEEEEEGEVEEEEAPIVTSSLPLFLRGNAHTGIEADRSTMMRSVAKRAHGAGETNEEKRETEEEEGDEPLPKRNKVFSLLRDPNFTQTLRKSSQRASPLVTTTTTTTPLRPS
jgi:hypothetical protein